MGWIANFWLILAHILLGRKNPLCFPCFIIGNSIWLYVSITRNSLDMAFLSGFFIIISMWNYYFWRID